MAERETSHLGSRRLAEILDAYGADPIRWPDAERDEAGALIADSTEAMVLRDAAAALDTVLSAGVAPAPSPELMANILALAEPSGWRRWAAEFWPFGPVWQPVSALATAAVLGIAIGAAAPSSILPEFAGYSAQEEAENMAFGADLGAESEL